MSQGIDIPDLKSRAHFADLRPILTYHDPTIEILSPFRPLLVRLYLEENQPLGRVMEYMRDNYAIKPALHAYKNRFRSWGMFKYNKCDKKRQLHRRNLDLQPFCRRCSPKLENCVVNPNNVPCECFRRKNASRNSREKFAKLSNRPSVLDFALSSVQRTLPMRELKYAQLSYVMRDFLLSSSSSGLCEAGHMGLLQWQSSDTKTARIADDFKMTMWHGIKYHIEERYKAAALCWEHALSQLEHLYHYPDLDIWAGYIKFCAELQRIQAIDVTKLMLNKLKCLIASANPPLRTEHMRLLRILTDISCEDLEEASLFFVEFELTIIQALWPEAKQTHFLYQLEVADRRLRMGYLQSEADLPDVNELYPVEERTDGHEFYIHACLISLYLVFGDNEKVGQVATQFIGRILKDGQVDQRFERELAASCYLLASTKLRQGDFTAACESLELSLDMYHIYRSKTRASDPFPWASIHRNLHLLDLIYSCNSSSQLHESNWSVHKQDLETQWDLQMQVWRENLPVSGRHLSNSNAKLHSSSTNMILSNSTGLPCFDEKPRFSFFPTFRDAKDSLSQIGILGF